MERGLSASASLRSMLLNGVLPFPPAIITMARSGSSCRLMVPVGPTIRTAAPGAAVRIVGPTGTMSLHDDPDRAIVMIAGGNGNTPFISMLRSEAEAERPRSMVMLYANHRPENAAYMDELRELEQRLDGFRLLSL